MFNLLRHLADEVKAVFVPLEEFIIVMNRFNFNEGWYERLLFNRFVVLFKFFVKSKRSLLHFLFGNFSCSNEYVFGIFNFLILSCVVFVEKLVLSAMEGLISNPLKPFFV